MVVVAVVLLGAAAVIALAARWLWRQESVDAMIFTAVAAMACLAGAADVAFRA